MIGARAACLVVLCLALAARGCEGAAPRGGNGWSSVLALGQAPDPPEGPQFCVVVRTYWGHSQADGSGLRRLIRSLQRQTVLRCVAGRERGGGAGEAQGRPRRWVIAWPGRRRVGVGWRAASATMHVSRHGAPIARAFSAALR